MRCRYLGGMPGPLSVTVSSTSAPTWPSTVMRPCSGVYLMALSMTLLKAGPDPRRRIARKGFRIQCEDKPLASSRGGRGKTLRHFAAPPRRRHEPPASVSGSSAAAGSSRILRQLAQAIGFTGGPVEERLQALRIVLGAQAEGFQSGCNGRHRRAQLMAGVGHKGAAHAVPTRTSSVTSCTTATTGRAVRDVEGAQRQMRSEPADG